MGKLDFLNFEVKAVPEEEGVFEGYASTWERDLIDDEITKALTPRRFPPTTPTAARESRSTGATTTIPRSTALASPFPPARTRRV